jgi:hypothetical protein
VAIVHLAAILNNAKKANNLWRGGYRCVENANVMETVVKNADVRHNKINN